MRHGTYSIGSFNTCLQTDNLLRQDIHSAVILGELAAHNDKGLAADCRPITVVDIGSHDHVRHAGLILDQKEDGSLSGLRPLACNDEASDLAFGSGVQMLEVPVERETGR